MATQWRDGRASWGIEPARIAALRDAADYTIYTPGSTSGVPLNVVGGLRRPPDGTDDETVTDDIRVTARSLVWVPSGGSNAT